MGVSRILIDDRDFEYGRALARAISNLHSEFEVTTVSLESVEAMNESKDLFHGYKLILIGGYTEDVVHMIRGKLSASGKHPESRIVILTDHPVKSLIKQTEEDENADWLLYKYRNIHDMIADLTYLIGVVTGKRNLPVKNSAPVMVGFYSISGGTGKTVVALGTSRELSRYHDKKVLYLSFEEIPVTGLWLRNHPDNRNIGDYLYHLFERKNESLCSRLDGFTASDEFGVESFYPANGRNDLNLLSREELISFLNIISESCRYDYIILDLKNDLAEETLFLMNLCGKVIWIQNDDPTADFKIGKLHAYLAEQHDFPWMKSMTLVVNRVKTMEPGREEYRDPSFDHIQKIFIENDEDSFRYRSNHLDVDISHGFGVGMKKIADQIVSETARQK